MKLNEFDYELPERLIAQHPAARRDDSWLMVLDRASGSIQHSRFRDLPRFLSSKDLLVLNNTRVFPARLLGRKHPTGARVEFLLLRQIDNRIWEVLLKPTRRVRPGTRVVFEAGGLEAIVLRGEDPLKRRVRFAFEGSFQEWLERLGQVPLPPYIRRPGGRPLPEDRERYQTVYAEVTGSIAAPTAGLHFTPAMLRRIPHAEITHHVGYGTFKPIQTEELEEHLMEPEYYEIGEAAASNIQAHLESGGRIIAVGTTTTRALESVFARHGAVVPERDWTNLYIHPGYRFGVVGGLITNLHLPRSTLLLLVSAFAGVELIRTAYEQAVRWRYRFYSYGDAMLVL